MRCGMTSTMAAGGMPGALLLRGGTVGIVPDGNRTPAARTVNTDAAFAAAAGQSTGPAAVAHRAVGNNRALGTRTVCALALCVFCTWAGDGRAADGSSPSGSELSGLARGPDHDPVAGHSPEDERRIRRYDSQRRRRSVEIGASHVDTMTGPVLPPAAPRLDGDRQAMVRSLTATPVPPAPVRHPGTLDPLFSAVPVPGPVTATSRPVPTPSAPASAPAPAPRTLLGAGTPAYGVLLTEASSADGGPVLVELLGGALRGARLAGELAPRGERLVLHFSRLWPGPGASPIPPEGLGVDAWGIEPDCACYGIAGTVDHHWWSRVILPAAAAFASGWAGAGVAPATTVTVDGATVVTRSGNATAAAVRAGAAGALRSVGTELSALAPDRPTVRIPAGTEIGVVFASPVRTALRKAAP